ncbi:MAG: hypothetical protein N3F66_14365 [Spirochaetes bacterium]|nr:hypothetical protein [Spirochaetota bacterium]
MYNVSKLFKDLCDSNNREFEMKLIIEGDSNIATEKIEENDSRISQTGYWATHEDTNNSGGSAIYSGIVGSIIQLSFIGTSVKLYGMANPYRGIAKITLDGVVEYADCYDAGTQYQKLLFSKNNLSNRQHTIIIEVTGQKNENAYDASIHIDYIEISSVNTTITTIYNNQIINAEMEKSLTTDNISIGNVISGKFMFSIYNEACQITIGEKVKPYIRVKDIQNISEWMPLGIFYVEEKNNNSDFITFICYDILYYSDEDISSYFTQFTYPIDTNSILNLFCNNLGLTLENINLRSITLNTNIFSEESYTIRQFLSDIAIINSANAIINYDGKLEFKKILTSSIIEKNLGSSDYINLSKNNEKNTLKKIKFLDGDNFYSMGEGTENETISKNINKLIKQNAEEIMLNIYSDINNFQYYPLTSQIRPHPYLEVGDKIEITEFKTNNILNTIITKLKLVYSGGLSLTIEGAPKVANNNTSNLSNIISKTIQSLTNFNKYQNIEEVILNNQINKSIISAQVDLSKQQSITVTIHIEGVASGSTDVQIQLLVDGTVEREFVIGATDDKFLINIKYLIPLVKSGQHIIQIAAKLLDEQTLTIPAGKAYLYIEAEWNLKQKITDILAKVEYKRAFYSPETTFEFSKPYITPPIVNITLSYENATVQNTLLQPAVELLYETTGGIRYYTGVKVHWLGNNIPEEIEGAYTNLIAICEV